MRKPVFEVSNQVPHKPGCLYTRWTTHEILYIGSKGIVLSMYMQKASFLTMQLNYKYHIGNDMGFKVAGHPRHKGAVIS